MNQVLAIQPTNPNALNYIAYSLATENLDLNQAEMLIRRALRLKSGDAAMIDTLGWVLYRQGRLKRAHAHIHRAVQLSPSNGEIRLHLACILDKMNQKEAAKTLYALVTNWPATQRNAPDLSKFGPPNEKPRTTLLFPVLRSQGHTDSARCLRVCQTMQRGRTRRYEEDCFMGLLSVFSGVVGQFLSLLTLLRHQNPYWPRSPSALKRFAR